ncbi:hypothetical protein LCGC14_0661650 [marine sediment metagenome]|uniref:Uncharacterized protein n=1 Tax=marine sediment metagenome TaxID=412755 RepID=A0A0F9QTD1_9ZZZZ
MTYRDRKSIEAEVDLIMHPKEVDFSYETKLMQIGLLQVELLLDIRGLLDEANQKQGVTRGEIWNQYNKDAHKDA